jgi:2-amino-4-hydroxy-6-hydroxymethyldihydropteridine diphosphokinase
VFKVILFSLFQNIFSNFAQNETHQMKNSYIIGISSNYDSEQNIASALAKLQSLFVDLICTNFIKTNPIGMPDEMAFHNGLAHFFSDEEPKAIKLIFKKIETELGRTSDKKKNGIIPIDIDIIVWNDTIVSKDIERDYVQELLSELKINR